MVPGELFPLFRQLCREHGLDLQQHSPPVDVSPDVSVYDAAFALDSGDVRLRVAEVIQPRIHAGSVLRIMAMEGTNFLLMPKISRRFSTELRALGVDHADAYGRVSLRAPTMLVEIEGNRVSNRNFDTDLAQFLDQHSRTSAIDLTSPKTAQIVFVLLSWPKLLRAPLRQISEIAGVSLGLVSRTITYLAETGFLIDGKGWTRSGRRQTAQAWLATYPSKLGPLLNLAFLEGPGPADIDVSDGMFSGGLAIPWLMNPATTTVYVNSTSASFLRRNRLRKGDHPNVLLKKLFWQTPPEEFSDVETFRGENTPVAPPLMVYADLISSDDPREQEMANVYLREEPRLQWLGNGNI
jgi:hypothetical protein